MNCGVGPPAPLGTSPPHATAAGGSTAAWTVPERVPGSPDGSADTLAEGVVPDGDDQHDRHDDRHAGDDEPAAPLGRAPFGLPARGELRELLVP